MQKRTHIYQLLAKNNISNHIFISLQLKPYVSVHTPKIELEDIIKIYKLNDYKDATNFGRFT